MTTDFKNLLENALRNNSYGFEETHKTIRSTLESSYSYLMETERCNIDYNEFHLSVTNDTALTPSVIDHIYVEGVRCYFNIKYDLITVGSRENFRGSRFYRSEFDINDMMEHPEIFNKIPIIMIDNSVIWDYTITMDNGNTKVYLPFRYTFVYTYQYNLVDNTPLLSRDTKFDISPNGELKAYTKEGSPINLDRYFIPARIRKTLDIIQRNNPTPLLAIKDEIMDEIKDYYEVGYYDDDGIVLYSLSNDIMYRSHDIDVMFVDNVFYQRITNVNKSSLEFDDSTNTIRVNKDFLNPVDAHDDGVMFCSLHFPNENDKGYELGTCLYDGVEDDDTYEFTLYGDALDKVKNARKDFFISLVFINRLHRYTTYRDENIVSTDDLMLFERTRDVPYELPIPVDNIVLLRQGDNVYTLESSSGMIDTFYPNIYKVKGNEKYKVFYFYDEVSSIKYSIMHEFYFYYLHTKFPTRCCEEVINMLYRKDNLPEMSSMSDSEKQEFFETFEKILNYQYFKYRYGDMDFLYDYKTLSENERKNAYEYELERMKLWITQDPDMLRNYVLNHNHKGVNMHLFSKLINLEGRKRKDTSKEFPNDVHEFEEDMYVFALSTNKPYPEKMECRFFINGLLAGDVQQYRNQWMEYVYIPTRLVSEDCYIEVEIFESSEFYEEFTFTSIDDSKTFTVIEPDENLTPTIGDIVFYNPDKSNRFDMKYFDIIEHYDLCDIELTDNGNPYHKFSRINHFTVKPRSEKVVGVPLMIQICKINNGVPICIKESGFPYVELIEKGFSCRENSVRIFRNGKLLPKTKYKYLGPLNRPRIKMLEEYNQGDILYFDFTPYQYTEVYHIDKLTTDIVNLKGIINKPFDGRYYDVYLNSRKMSLNNIIPIDPWSFKLVNVDSLDHLYIYERERDMEYYGLDYTNHIYYYSIEDLLNSSFMTDSDRKTIIDYIIDKQKIEHMTIRENTTDEPPEDYSEVPRDILFYCDFDTFYSSAVVGLRYMNPDELQLSEEIIEEEFPSVYEIYLKNSEFGSRNAIEEHRKKSYPNIMYLNPELMAYSDKSENTSTTPMIIYNIGQGEFTESCKFTKFEMKEDNQLKDE